MQSQEPLPPLHQCYHSENRCNNRLEGLGDQESRHLLEVSHNWGRFSGESLKSWHNPPQMHQGTA